MTQGYIRKLQSALTCLTSTTSGQELGGWGTCSHTVCTGGCLLSSGLTPPPLCASTWHAYTTWKLEHKQVEKLKIIHHLKIRAHTSRMREKSGIHDTPPENIWSTSRNMVKHPYDKQIYLEYFIAINVSQIVSFRDKYYKWKHINQICQISKLDCPIVL